MYIHFGGRILNSPPGTNLWQSLLENGELIGGGCGGRGRCGDCRVMVKDSIGEHSVLACKYTPQENIEVRLPPCQSSLNQWQLVNPPPSDSLFAGIDIGTTTVGIFLVDNTGSITAQHKFLNPQIYRGSEVMSRLAAARDPAVRGLLHKSLQLALNNCFKRLEGEIGISAAQIARAVMVGNGAMSVLVLGLDGSCLAEAPYTNPISRNDLIDINPVEWGLSDKTSLLLLPPAGGFLGSDAIAGALWAWREVKLPDWIYIDLGTNSEVLLHSRGRWWGLSAAAGPAFEGGGLACGVSAVKGAVQRIIFTPPGEVEVEVIGGFNPIGICGSGAISILAELLRNSGLDRSGRLPEGFPGVVKRDGILRWNITPEGDIYLTQQDIRALQLAKAAIAAGIRVMLDRGGLQASEVKEICLTGAFGSGVSLEDLTEIGMIPAGVPVRFISEGAGRGAALAAADEVFQTEVVQLNQELQFINPAEESEFNRMLIDNISF